MTMPIKGSVNVTLSIEDVNKINALIRRDTARPIKVHHYEVACLKGQTQEICPVCDRMILKLENFCPNCGQRIDHDNIEI